MSPTNLFPPDLLPTPATTPTTSQTFSLPPNYKIRPLQRTDYSTGMLDVLRVLTTVGDISETAWLERFDYMHDKAQDTYYVLVVCDDSERVVGTGAVIVERKLYVYSHCENSENCIQRGANCYVCSIHGLGLVGHIEDIAVAKDQQGKKLGLSIIQALDCLAEKVGCYKTILDCSEANEGFYVKCGYKRAGLEMAHYYEK